MWFQKGERDWLDSDGKKFSNGMHICMILYGKCEKRREDAWDIDSIDPLGEYIYVRKVVGLTAEQRECRTNDQALEEPSQVRPVLYLNGTKTQCGSRGQEDGNWMREEKKPQKNWQGRWSVTCNVTGTHLWLEWRAEWGQNSETLGATWPDAWESLSISLAFVAFPWHPWLFQLPPST